MRLLDGHLVRIPQVAVWRRRPLGRRIPLYNIIMYYFYLILVHRNRLLVGIWYQIRTANEQLNSRILNIHNLSRKSLHWKLRIFSAVTRNSVPKILHRSIVRLKTYLCINNEIQYFHNFKWNLDFCRAEFFKPSVQVTNKKTFITRGTNNPVIPRGQPMETILSILSRFWYRLRIRILWIYACRTLKGFSLSKYKWGYF